MDKYPLCRVLSEREKFFTHSIKVFTIVTYSGRNIDGKGENEKMKTYINFIPIEEIEGFAPVFEFLEEGYRLTDYLFFDIETTGFSVDSSRYAMTGFFYFDGERWWSEQYLAESKSDQRVVLLATYYAMLRFKRIVTFNGNDFDLPFFFEKLRMFTTIQGEHLLDRSLDLLPLMRKVKAQMGFENCKLKTIEKHLGINRTFFIEGELLAESYRQILEGNEIVERDYVGYNQEDVVWLAQIMSIMSETLFSRQSEEREVLHAVDNHQPSLF